MSENIPPPVGPNGLPASKRRVARKRREEMTRALDQKIAIASAAMTDSIRKDALQDLGFVPDILLTVIASCPTDPSNVPVGVFVRPLLPDAVERGFAEQMDYTQPATEETNTQRLLSVEIPGICDTITRLSADPVVRGLISAVVRRIAWLTVSSVMENMREAGAVKPRTCSAGNEDMAVLLTRIDALDDRIDAIGPRIMLSSHAPSWISEVIEHILRDITRGDGMEPVEPINNQIEPDAKQHLGALHGLLRVRQSIYAQIPDPERYDVTEKHAPPQARVRSADPITRTKSADTSDAPKSPPAKWDDIKARRERMKQQMFENATKLVSAEPAPEQETPDPGAAPASENPTAIYEQTNYREPYSTFYTTEGIAATPSAGSASSKPVEATDAEGGAPDGDRLDRPGRIE